ncbi:MAG: hypothetical protein K0R39_2571 [Symbiobacteriaceae bacterium]|jgi:hypothetical protein|nr:hypothetical protein [Symbiobacteriaceae bacterium]
MVGSPGPDDHQSRIIKLGDLVTPGPSAFWTIRFDRKTALADRAASKLIADVGEAQGEGRAPTWLLIARSAKNAEELIGVPGAIQTPDALEMVWGDQGRYVRIKAARLLAYRQATIPTGTRMFIRLYAEDDPTYGKVVGIQINAATFRPIDYLTEEEKAARAEKRRQK